MCLINKFNPSTLTRCATENLQNLSGLAPVLAASILTLSPFLIFIYHSIARWLDDLRVGRAGEADSGRRRSSGSCRTSGDAPNPASPGAPHAQVIDLKALRGQ